REPVEELVLVVRDVLPPEEDRHVGHEQRRDGGRGRVNDWAVRLDGDLLAANTLRGGRGELAARRNEGFEPRLRRGPVNDEEDGAARVALDHVFEQVVHLRALLL